MYWRSTLRANLTTAEMPRREPFAASAHVFGVRNQADVPVETGPALGAAIAVAARTLAK